jgi:hypothetical protein
MKSKLVIVSSWVIVFLLGAVAGAVGHYLYREPLKPAAVPMPPAKPGAILDRMANMLQLDAQQKETLKSIFAESRQKYRALGQQYRPQWEAIRDETDEQIKQILRTEQRARYEEFLKKAYSPPPGRRPPQPTPNKPQ